MIRKHTRFFCGDALLTAHQHDFLNDPHFQECYAEAVNRSGRDHHVHWRIKVALWAADTAMGVGGDFVECGVNYGFFSAAISHHLDWGRKTGARTFWLCDWFKGSLVPGDFNTNPDAVRNRWPRQRVIVGEVPDSLKSVTACKVAFLHLDMNHYRPELAAAEFFRPLLAQGAVILLDDYNFVGFEEQHQHWDAYAKRVGWSILPLPTGQGLIIAQ